MRSQYRKVKGNDFSAVYCASFGTMAVVHLSEKSARVLDLHYQQKNSLNTRVMKGH